MKYVLNCILTIAVLHIFGSAIHAQNSESSINVSATVQPSAIEVVTLEEMNLMGAERVAGRVEINPVISERAGKMVALGSPNASFRLSYDRVWELVNTEGPGVIFIEFDVAGHPTDEQESSELYQEETRELEFSGEGEFYIWIGGQIDLSNAAMGNYEGEFTLELEYNN